MTRKQAIYQAIQALSALGGKEEAITLLQDIYDEMPLIHWSDKSIRDTVEQFIVDNGRMPTASDFRKKGMPPHPVIKQKYGITLGEWLEQNYPTPKPDREVVKQRYTQEFVEEYIRIKPTSSDDFNKRRSPYVKTWISVAKYHNVKSWCALLSVLALPSYSYVSRAKKRTKFNVTVHTDCDFLN
jgi:hypothetical protein